MCSARAPLQRGALLACIAFFVGCGVDVLAPERFEFQTPEEKASAKDGALVHEDTKADATHDVSGAAEDAALADVPALVDVTAQADASAVDTMDATLPNDSGKDAAGTDTDADADAAIGTDQLTEDTAIAPNPCSNPTSTDPCDDGNVCTLDDRCKGGLCLPTATTVCADGNPCTEDTCDPKFGCQYASKPMQGAACDADGSKCTQGDKCIAGACVAGALKGCSDNNPCTADSCVAQSGACEHVNANDGLACEDGKICTIGQFCASGACVGNKVKDCEDGNACTKDSCAEKAGGFAGGCRHEVQPGACDDGGKCTIEATCADGSCIVTKTGIPAACEDNNVCTKEACSAKSGCVHLPVSGKCNDGDACSKQDTCAAGECAGLPLPATACDDVNACTKDTCEPAKGCVNAPLGGSCDDNNKCTVFDVCAKGKCAGTPVAATSCSDDNPCTEDSCDAKQGCVNADTHGTCDDGNPCTQSDVCNDKACKGTPLPSAACDDDNPCTKDGCDPGKGCTHSHADGGPCNDGDLCTGPDECVAGKCVGAPGQASKTCDDGNSCTVDSCPIGQLKPTCQHAPNTEACDDTNACTSADRCDQGTCVGTPIAPTAVCDDGNPCTKDRCDSGAAPGKACAHDKLSDTPCDDGNPCTTPDGCIQGQCAGAPVDVTATCDDGNPCTAEACDPAAKVSFAAKACTHDPIAAPCSDGNPCTVGDACKQKVCVGGGPRTCHDTNPCTQDSCLPSTAGGCAHVFVTKSCDDGDPCTVGDTCIFGACKGKPRNCDDNKPCTTDACSAKQSDVCSHEPAVGSCDDGKVCTVSDACAAGQCSGVPLPDQATCNDAAACQAIARCKSGACVTEAASKDGDACDDANPCTAATTCAAGKCQGKSRDCDDQDACTVDACDPKAAGVTACTHTPTAAAAQCKDGGPCLQAACDAKTGKCTTVDLCKPRVILDETFECAGKSAFSLVPSAPEPDVGWHVDATPTPPGFKSKGCSLNFNDGKDYSNGKRVQGTATSKALPLPHSTTPTLQFWSFHGVELHAKYDLRYVEVSDDGFTKNVQSLRLDNLKSAGQWAQVVVELHQWRRKVVQLRFRFDSVDGSSNGGPGWFVDDVRVSSTLGPGSCKGHCGAYEATAACQCDVACALYRDCCADLQEICGGCQADADCAVGESCSTATCDLATGACKHALATDGKGCDDGDPCTLTDKCHSGVCAGQAMLCDDANPCTTDSCGADPKDKTNGKCSFQTLASGAACDDGDACTGPDTCASAKCAAPKLNCDDGNSCTANGCDTTVGCTITHLAIACEDGSLCTQSDSCQAGKCVAGKPVSCSDNNPCTLDLCDGKSGSCQHSPRPDGTGCGDGKTCVQSVCKGGGGTCGNHKLEPGEACDDGNTKDGDGCSAACKLETPDGMVTVPAGPFWMGCNTAVETCTDAAKPQHLVELSGFWIDRDEVSVGDYAACMGAGKCTAPNPHNANFALLLHCNYQRAGAEKHPVNCVDHAQATAYCTWAGKRLPTEAEWEKAARGGCETLPGQDCKIAARVYPWGAAPPTCEHAMMSAEPPCGAVGTMAAGGRVKGTSPYGARDMLGNVAEWASDWYDKGYYASSPAKDPQGPADTGKKPYRGGAYSYLPSVLRASMRFNFAVANHRAATIGFRCAKDLPTK